jgi:hypothetical protein
MIAEKPRQENPLSQYTLHLAKSKKERDGFAPVPLLVFREIA